MPGKRYYDAQGKYAGHSEGCLGTLLRWGVYLLLAAWPFLIGGAKGAWLGIDFLIECVWLLIVLAVVRQVRRGKAPAVTQAATAAGVSPPPLPSPAPMAAVGPTTPPKVVNELERLAELHTRGLLSDEEFAAAKRKILGA